MSSRSDRLNPVLLKEVRQSLRGRVFAFVFPATVAVGVALAITVLVDGGPRMMSGATPSLGPLVFMPVITVLGVALLGLVPFSAFQSMAGEWDEATHDLLVLSHLSPARIVFGKLLTAAVEAALYVCAFLPMLLFTFLLSGVDVRDILFLTGLLYVTSLAMCCVAMSLAGLSRLRFWRVILLAALAGIGFLALIGGYELTQQFVVRGRGLGSASADVFWALSTVVLGVGALAFAFAATRIAHGEDDRSGPVRATLTAVLVAVLVVAHSMSGGRDEVGVVSAAGVATAIFAIGFVTEPERLPRRTRANVPANPLLALLVTPFLPGGGRGVMWWLLQLVICFAWAEIAPSPPIGGVMNEFQWSVRGTHRWLALMSYFFVYLAAISLVTTRFRDRPWGPLVMRLALPSIAVLSMVLPIVFGFVVGHDDLEDGEHGLMPFWVAFSSSANSERNVAILVATVVLLANGPRFARSISEVLDASRARRAARRQPAEVAARAT